MKTFNLEKQGECLTFFGDANSSASVANVEVRLAPGAIGPSPHIHTRQTENFHVVSGTMIVQVDGQEQTVAVGETLVVKAGQAHTFANGSEIDPLIIRGSIEPALHFQWFLTEAAKAAIRAGGSWKDLPILEVSYLLHQMRDEYRLAGIPVLLQDIIFGMLARVAVLLGRTQHILPKDAVRSSGHSTSNNSPQVLPDRRSDVASPAVPT